jgi:hypothetical protein
MSPLRDIFVVFSIYTGDPNSLYVHINPDIFSNLNLSGMYSFYCFHGVCQIDRQKEKGILHLHQRRRRGNTNRDLIFRGKL